MAVAVRVVRARSMLADWWAVGWRVWVMAAAIVAVYVGVWFRFVDADADASLWEAMLAGGVLFGLWFAGWAASIVLVVWAWGGRRVWWAMGAMLFPALVAGWPGVMVGVLSGWLGWTVLTDRRRDGGVGF